jgi:hypothetical protein
VTDSNAKAFLGRGWGFPVALNGDGQAAMVAHEDDIRQAIRLILETAHGERVMRPDFGAGLRALVFEPMNTTTMALVRHRVEQALVRWEPRIDVHEVRVTADQETAGMLLVEIRYEVRATNIFYNLVFPFYLQEGEG